MNNGLDNYYSSSSSSSSSSSPSTSPSPSPCPLPQSSLGPSPSPTLTAHNVKSSNHNDTDTNGNHLQPKETGNPPPHGENLKDAPKWPNFKPGPLSRKPWEYEQFLESTQIEDIIYDSLDEESDIAENDSTHGNQPKSSVVPSDGDMEERDASMNSITSSSGSISNNVNNHLYNKTMKREWTSCLICESDVLSHKLASHVMKYHMLRDFRPKVCHIESCSKCLPNYDGMLIIPTQKMKLKIPKTHSVG